MFSYWEQQSFTYYDFVIIGSGIVGLSTAIELKERYPAARVLVLERGLIPTGASTRNAGFACMGSATELLDDLQTMEESEVVELFEWRKLGLERLRNRLGDTNIGYEANGSYELIGEEELDVIDKIEYLNKLLVSVTGKDAFRQNDEKIGTFGFSSQKVKALIENTCEGELHTGKMMQTVLQLAFKLGIEVKTGAEVTGFEESDKYVYVTVKDPFRKEVLLLHAGKLCICTNAFTPKLLKDEDVVAGRGQVLITQPIHGLKFKGIFHFDKGYYYFREIDNRVLLGGGRNLDFEGEATDEFATTQQIQLQLERILHEVILPDTDYHIAQRWSGIMAFGKSKYPIVKTVSSKVFGAFRMGGMGVALGSQVALQLADITGE